MSRRVPNPAADRAAQNQQTIKSLLKLDANKSCADCKRNKHPRWASWNLGIFVCIRCSGIHRGMGTHISRVKSVDLDAWTDEQLQSVLRWGNARANKYWEAKLALGHVPSEAKIENFIRTKYESKRWVMDGGIPDPSTLDTEGDDDVPLNIVQEKAKLERASSQKAASVSSRPTAPARSVAPTVDLIGSDVVLPPVRPNTTDNPTTRPAVLKATAVPKQSRPAESLLGLDFFGGPPERPASASSNTVGTTAPSRPDLKQSILSLYASAPKSQSQTSTHERQGSFGGMQSPTSQPSAGLGGMSDAFSGLTFTSPTSPPAPQPPPPPQSSPFSSLGSLSNQRSIPAPSQKASSPLQGGGFFDTSPKLPQKPTIATKSAPAPPQTQRTFSSSSGFGDFTSAFESPTATAKPSITNASNSLFDFSEPTPVPPKTSVPAPSINSAFNLSAPAPQPQATSKPAPVSQPSFSGFSSSDAWGSNDAWATPEPPSIPTQTKAAKPPPVPSATMDDFGWGSSTSGTTSNLSTGGFGSQAPPKVAAEEDFGGWESSMPAAPAPAPAPAASSSAQTSRPGGGFTASEDLFSNVWE